MRPDRLYLADIEQAAQAIDAFLASADERGFLGDDLLQSAVLQKLTVIGEAAARISEDLRCKHPEVEWGVVVGLRNIVVHAYFAISWATIWETAKSDVPRLLEQVRSITRGLPGSDPG